MLPTPGKKVAAGAIEETQPFRLSVQDQRAIAAAILDPPTPNDALMRAAAAYQGLVQSVLNKPASK